MKKLKLTKLERRIVIILMIINSFAFSVNYFQLSSRFLIDYECYIYILTDAGDSDYSNDRRKSYSFLYEEDYRNNFWPFLKFYQEHNSWNPKRYEFRGLFPDYDHTEFIVYCLIIFGSVFIKKIW